MARQIMLKHVSYVCLAQLHLHHMVKGNAAGGMAHVSLTLTARSHHRFEL